MIPNAKKHAQDVQQLMKRLITSANPAWHLVDTYGLEYDVKVESDGTHVVFCKEALVFWCKPSGEVFLNIPESHKNKVPDVPILIPLSNRTVMFALAYLNEMVRINRDIIDLLPPPPFSDDGWTNDPMGT